MRVEHIPAQFRAPLMVAAFAATIIGGYAWAESTVDRWVDQRIASAVGERLAAIEAKLDLLVGQRPQR